jgi:glycosyltransferase involved in cell wall biosynthesis
VIENGFDLENLIRAQRFEGSFRRGIGVSPKQVLIGAVGRLVPIKGCTYLLKACVDILKSMPDTRLTFVGDGELREELKAEAIFHGIESQVLFTGFRKDMENIYSDLNLLVIPSLNEGLPTVLIEALCAGVPVVATGVGAIPDLVNENSGIIVEPKDTKALSSAIRQMLQDPFRSLSNDVRKKNYERFSSKRFIKDMEQFYMEISSNNS